MDHAYTSNTTMLADTGKPLIQWRAVFGGTILGLGSMVLMTSLIMALAFGRDIDTVRVNIDMYLAGAGIVAMVLGGFLAGWLSGIRGPGVGFVNGATVWSLVLLLALTVGTPVAIGRLSETQLSTLGSDGSWMTFWSLLVALGAAALGGMLGGMIPRRRYAAMLEREEEVTREETVPTERHAPAETHRRAS